MLLKKNLSKLLGFNWSYLGAAEGGGGGDEEGKEMERVLRNGEEGETWA